MDHDSKLLKEAYEKMPKPEVLNETLDINKMEAQISILFRKLEELRQDTARSIDNVNDRVDRLQWEN